jgi:hypothetical protein
MVRIMRTATDPERPGLDVPCQTAQAMNRHLDPFDAKKKLERPCREARA